MDGKGSQCLGEAGRSLLLESVSVLVKNFIMFLVICFLVSLLFSSSSSKSVGFPKVYCLSSVKAEQTSKMCIAVSILIALCEPPVRKPVFPFRVKESAAATV